MKLILSWSYKLLLFLSVLLISGQERADFKEIQEEHLEEWEEILELEEEMDSPFPLGSGAKTFFTVLRVFGKYVVLFHEVLIQPRVIVPPLRRALFFQSDKSTSHIFLFFGDVSPPLH